MSHRNHLFSWLNESKINMINTTFNPSIYDNVSKLPLAATYCKFTHKWCERCYIRTFQVSRNVGKTWLVELLEMFLCLRPSTSLQNWHRPTASPWRLHKNVFWLQAQRGAVERRYPSLAWFAPDVQSLAGAARPGAHWWSKVQKRAVC